MCTLGPELYRAAPLSCVQRQFTDEVNDRTNIFRLLSSQFSRSEPYDPYLPSGNSSTNPTGAPSAGGTSKTAAIQAQIDDTVGIMRENITKVAERGEHLNALQDKTG